jgi:hypothetical protein
VVALGAGVLLVTGCGSANHKKAAVAPSAASSVCPRTPAHGGGVGGIANPIGSGPVYASLGMTAEGFVPLADDPFRHGGHEHKTLFAVAPTYRDTVTFRGQGGPHGPPLQFYILRKRGGRLSTKLRIQKAKRQTRDGKRRGWRYGVAAVLLPGPGCYSFRVKGRGLTQPPMIFEATIGNAIGGTSKRGVEVVGHSAADRRIASDFYKYVRRGCDRRPVRLCDSLERVEAKNRVLTITTDLESTAFNRRIARQICAVIQGSDVADFTEGHTVRGRSSTRLATCPARRY